MLVRYAQVVHRSPASNVMFPVYERRKRRPPSTPVLGTTFHFSSMQLACTPLAALRHSSSESSISKGSVSQVSAGARAAGASAMGRGWTKAWVRRKP